jgi:rare lipoprotein A
VFDTSTGTGVTKAQRTVRGLLFLIALSWYANAYAVEEPRNAPAGSDSPPTSAPSGSASVSDKIETGLAAVYSDRLHGRKTASGQRYDRNALTAAHKTLPFGTRVKITNKKNDKSVLVRINDRGPTQAGRILDISPRAAKALGMRRTAMAQVTAEVTNEPPKRNKK